MRVGATQDLHTQNSKPVPHYTFKMLTSTDTYQLEGKVKRFSREEQQHTTCHTLDAREEKACSGSISSLYTGGDNSIQEVGGAKALLQLQEPRRDTLLATLNPVLTN